MENPLIMSLKNFMSKSVGLTRNPLGIIGLFISLIYGFSCAVLGFSITNLNTSCERLPLIWFIVIFPILILGAFIYLVIYHHSKLYAPSDFKDDSTFLKIMTDFDIDHKLDEEVDLLMNSDVDTTKITTENIKPTNNTSSDSREIKNRIELASKWAVKELELKFNTKFKTNQQIVSRYSKIELEASSDQKNEFIIGEIKYWESTKPVNPLLLSIQNSIIKIVSNKSIFGNKKITIAIVIVFDKIEKVLDEKVDSFLRNNIINLLNKQSIDVTLVYMPKDFENLKKEYMQD